MKCIKGECKGVCKEGKGCVKRGRGVLRGYVLVLQSGGQNSACGGH